MSYDAHKHHRRSIRLKGYDYRQSGAYFVTICVRDGQCLLGEVIHGEMALNEVGRAVETAWLRTAELRYNAELDAYVVMPNHFHGILLITHGPPAGTQEAALGGAREETPVRTVNAASVGAQRAAPQGRQPDEPPPRRVEAGSLGAIVRSFKSAATKAINEAKDTPSAPFWQRNYYEQIIRNERHLQAVRHYIQGNPAAWEQDRLHPAAGPNRFNRRWREGHAKA